MDRPTPSAPATTPSAPLAAERRDVAEQVGSVLVVDDLQTIRDLLAAVLSSARCRVVTVGSVSEAQVLLEQRSFDLIVSDFSMPDGNGSDLLSVVRHDDIRQPFVLMSAACPPNVVEAAEPAGEVVIDKVDIVRQLSSLIVPAG